MNWLIDSKVKKLTVLLQATQESNVAAKATLSKLNWYEFSERRQIENHITHNEGLIAGLQISINILNDKNVR
jgi:hypothetical protein